jgi:hypothetical protein
MGYRGDNGRQHRGHRDGGGEREQREPRAPLQWRTEQTFQHGRIVLVLQAANLDNGGVRRSFRIGKESQDQPDKPFPFMDPRDIVSVREVLAQMENHLAGDRTSGLAD